MASKYEVYSDGRFHAEHSGLTGACVDARTSAVARPGVEFEVMRGDVDEYSAVVTGGKLTTWMR